MSAHTSAVIALIGNLVFLLLAFGLRSVVHYRRTGTSGFVGVRAGAGLGEWCGAVLFAVALLAAVAAPVLQLTGAVEPLTGLAGQLGPVVGIALYVVGAAGTLAAQFAMGTSWRIGVDPEARTALVESGPFRWVRNPIYSAMLLTVLGLVLLVPTAASVLAFASLVAALEIQVRLVEEPYLAETHGEPYRRYAAATGRFVPGLGRGVG